MKNFNAKTQRNKIAKKFGLRRLDAAFLDATCRVVSKRGHIRALQNALRLCAFAPLR
jgi:hypothetical protein